MKCFVENNQHWRVVCSHPDSYHVCVMKSLLDMTMQLCCTPKHLNILSLLQKVDLIGVLFVFLFC